MNTTHSKQPVARFIGKCSRCKKVHKVEGELERTGKGIALIAGLTASFWKGAWQMSTQCCGKSLLLRRVVSTGNVDHECSARCTSATGFQCSCACGGVNHGSAA